MSKQRNNNRKFIEIWTLVCKIGDLSNVLTYMGLTLGQSAAVLTFRGQHDTVVYDHREQAMELQTKLNHAYAELYAADEQYYYETDDISGWGPGDATESTKNWVATAQAEYEKAGQALLDFYASPAVVVVSYRERKDRWGATSRYLVIKDEAPKHRDDLRTSLHHGWVYDHIVGFVDSLAWSERTMFNLMLVQRSGNMERIQLG